MADDVECVCTVAFLMLQDCYLCRQIRPLPRSLVSTLGRETKNRRWLRGSENFFEKLLNGGNQSVWRGMEAFDNMHNDLVAYKMSNWAANARTVGAWVNEATRLRALPTMSDVETLEAVLQKRVRQGVRIHLLAWNGSGCGHY